MIYRKIKEPVLQASFSVEDVEALVRRLRKHVSVASKRKSKPTHLLRPAAKRSITARVSLSKNPRIKSKNFDTKLLVPQGATKDQGRQIVR